MAIEFVQIPSADLLVPDEVYATTTDTQKIIVKGKNFTEYTECEIDLVPMDTVYLTDSLLECQVPSGKGGEKKQVILKERGLYYSGELSISYRERAFVTDLSPRKAFRTEKSPV